MIDIYLVSGFLGAGKTTLIKNLTKVFENEKVGLIVNEFGPKGVDGITLGDEGMVIEQIVDGSIFCVCRSDRFIDAILKTREMDVDCLLVESSGLADPFGMHEVNAMLQKLSPDTFHYSGSICVIDAKHFTRLSDIAPVLVDQVEGSDLLLINKTDLSTPEEVAGIERSIRKLNSEAPILRTSFARIPDVSLIQGLKWLKGTRKGFLVKQTPGIEKLVLSFDPVSIDKLVTWLKEWTDRVYRVKGFSAENGRQFFVQAVNEDVNVTEMPQEEKESYLVVLAPAENGIKNEIRSSWSRHFQTNLHVK